MKAFSAHEELLARVRESTPALRQVDYSWRDVGEAVVFILQYQDDSQRAGFEALAATVKRQHPELLDVEVQKKPYPDAHHCACRSSPPGGGQQPRVGAAMKGWGDKYHYKLIRVTLPDGSVSTVSFKWPEYVRLLKQLPGQCERALARLVREAVLQVEVRGYRGARTAAMRKQLIANLGAVRQG